MRDDEYLRAFGGLHDEPPERRQQIGMLRAIGFQKQMVSFVFLLETAYVVILGIIAGTAMGLILARNLLTSDTEDLNVEFHAP